MSEFKEGEEIQEKDTVQMSEPKVGESVDCDGKLETFRKTFKYMLINISFQRGGGYKNLNGDNRKELQGIGVRGIYVNQCVRVYECDFHKNRCVQCTNMHTYGLV